MGEEMHPGDWCSLIVSNQMNFHVPAVGAEARRLVEGQGAAVELPHVQLQPMDALLLRVIPDEADHRGADAQAVESRIHAELVDIQEIPRVHERILRTDDMVQYGKAAYCTVRFRHNNLLVRILPDGMDDPAARRRSRV